MHQAIGEREEIGHGDRTGGIAGALAAHFQQAGDDRRAVRYLAEAADTASRQHANAEAVGYVARALDIRMRALVLALLNEGLDAYEASGSAAKNGRRRAR